MYLKGVAKFFYSCSKYYIKAVTVHQFEGTWGLIKWFKKEWDCAEDSTDESPANQQEREQESQQDPQQDSEQVPSIPAARARPSPSERPPH
jgi:putative component of membrane protein insertase Oxa1/YidC/SpoIIIJ protein YidD